MLMPGTVHDVMVPSGDTPLRAYVATPPVGDGPWPGVVVVHDVFGLTDVTREHADHLAAAGYVAVAPDLYTRGGMVRCVRSTFRALFSRQGRAMDDLDAVRAWVLDRPDTTGRVGIIGFCMGGGFALATVDRGYDASAPNYGPLPKDLDDLVGGACPVVASYGAKDRGLRHAAGTLEAALSDAGVAHDVKEYAEAGHSFMDRLPLGPLGPVARIGGFAYHQTSAADAWDRILRFFATHLAA
jgi:carboxymethylenebutenolidase